MPFTIRPLEPDDWEVFRDLRHRSLADSPDAFRSTEAETLAMPDEEWRQIVERTTTSPRGLLLVAERNGTVVGGAFGRTDDEAHVLHIGAMWVDPTMRGLGIGRALLDETLEWGGTGGATSAELWVVDDNGPAVALYRSAGFEPTGEHGFLREGSEIPIVAMAHRL